MLLALQTIFLSPQSCKIGSGVNRPNQLAGPPTFLDRQLMRQTLARMRLPRTGLRMPHTGRRPGSRYSCPIQQPANILFLFFSLHVHTCSSAAVLQHWHMQPLIFSFFVFFSLLILLKIISSPSKKCIPFSILLFLFFIFIFFYFKFIIFVSFVCIFCNSYFSPYFLFPFHWFKRVSDINK